VRKESEMVKMNAATQLHIVQAHADAVKVNAQTEAEIMPVR
jgi:hypothetical protein